ncbi:hypothetical protein B0G74_6293 [Paraburkholderia sp. BL9I2N2]|nr:hypothetical protein B0G74_6293 [Paraburkholderia sp. BL9I2N2]
MVAAKERTMTSTLTSQAFQQNGEIPARYTCISTTCMRSTLYCPI